MNCSLPHEAARETLAEHLRKHERVLVWQAAGWAQNASTPMFISLIAVDTQGKFRHARAAAPRYALCFGALHWIIAEALPGC